MRVRITALAAACLFAAAASARESGGAEQAVEAELLRVDAEFSEAAQKIGIGEAFVRFADAGAVMLPANENAVTGLEAVRRQFADLPPGTTLVWSPFKAEVAASGDLGYTLGTYELRGKGADGQSTIRYGKYCSVWKKHKDGRWQWVVDVGTPSPAPK